MSRVLSFLIFFMSVTESVFANYDYQQHYLQMVDESQKNGPLQYITSEDVSALMWGFWQKKPETELNQIIPSAREYLTKGQDCANLWLNIYDDNLNKKSFPPSCIQRTFEKATYYCADDDSVKKLLELGADPNSLENGFSSFYWIIEQARSEGCISTLKLVLKSGKVNPNDRITLGRFNYFEEALYSIMSNVHLNPQYPDWAQQILQLFLENGADPFLQNHAGSTPIYTAAKFQNDGFFSFPKEGRQFIQDFFKNWQSPKKTAFDQLLTSSDWTGQTPPNISNYEGQTYMGTGFPVDGEVFNYITIENGNIKRRRYFSKGGETNKLELFSLQPINRDQIRFFMGIEKTEVERFQQNFDAFSTNGNFPLFIFSKNETNYEYSVHVIDFGSGDNSYYFSQNQLKKRMESAKGAQDL